jgi:hypothetical protein
MGRRCETEASIPLDAIRCPRDRPIWTHEAALKCRSCGRRRYKPPVHMSSDARDHALIFGCIQTKIARKRAGDAILSPCRWGSHRNPVAARSAVTGSSCTLRRTTLSERGGRCHGI